MHRICNIDIRKIPQTYKEIDKFARKLAKTLPVTEIYLYGSFATGKIHEGSDIDLIVVGAFKERFFDRIYKVMSLTDLPVEPLVYTVEEFKRKVEGENPFIMRALKEGKKLL